MKYRKKPLVIDAVQWTGRNMPQMEEFLGFSPLYDRGGGFTIDTLEGSMRASTRDWVIKGVQGEFYPCKPDIFETTYEAVE